MKSGLNIGKSVVGGQTTTLLLAYMGSYITVMMVIMAQGTPVYEYPQFKAYCSRNIAHLCRLYRTGPGIPINITYLRPYLRLG